MTQYRSIKVTEQDYNTLKRYMHLGFTDSMTEAFHKAINTAMFEEYGEPTPAEQRKEWNAEELAKVIEPVEQVEHKEVIENVPRAKRHYNRKKKVPK